ncbi:unnamed protein product [Eruca vesicaria subsp. sativa]|uniref:Neprosin PEP catalytic domain-containing protein n=1 Tax=Eruca vesicaria subsp. sativa TaxID=29727 RepID=A0ABC8KDU3_ERUVS|nr:unnamed protein product [Eruca vesicaria subsp. sativa]
MNDIHLMRTELKWNSLCESQTDQKLGSWWLGLLIDDGLFEPIGYWPSFLFTLLNEYAVRVEWGGEIVNTQAFGHHTSTQMGSGCNRTMET